MAIDLGYEQGNSAPGAAADAELIARRRARRSMWRLLALLLLMTAVLRLPAFFVEVFNSDETFLATQAEVINEGGRLYEDAADRKPPLVPYLYATVFALVGSTALWSVRVVAMLAVVATAMLLAIEARRRYGERAAWLAAILFVLASVAFAPQDGQAANFEVFMLPAITAAMVFANRDRAGASGVAIAFATLAKQTGAATLLPVLYLVSKRHGRRGVIATLLGFALPIAVVALLVGPGDLLFWGVLGNGSYFGLGTVSAYVVGLFAVMTLAFIGLNLPIIWSLPTAWKERAARPDTDLWIWLASSALALAVGFRFFGHYYLQLLPPLCLISAGVLARRGQLALRATLGLAAVLAVACSLLGFFVKPWGDDPQYQTVSRYLDTHTLPTDRIFVWGHMPEIYWASGLRPATRFLSSGFPVGDWGSRQEGDESANVPTPGAYDQMMLDLHAHRPRYFLDTTPAAFRGSQYSPISKYPALEQFVRSGYRKVTTLDGIAIYQQLAEREAAGK